MPLSTTATYTQFGTVNVAGLAIDNPATYAGQTLQLTVALPSAGRGRFTTERVSAPNIRGGNAGIFYEELNWMQITGAAEEINSLLGTLRYHADASGFSADFVAATTLAVWNGANIGSGTVQFTHRPLYDNPPLNWTEAIGVGRQYAAYTPNSVQAFNLPAVGPNDATMFRMTVEAANTVPFYEVRGNFSLDASLQPTPTIPANTIFAVNGTIVGTYSNFTAMQTGLVAATAPGQPLFRYRVQPRRRSSDNAIVGLRLHYLDRFEQNEIGVPSSASFSHGTMLGSRAEIIRDANASHPYGNVVRMIEESNRSTEWDGVLSFYSHRQAINSALFRTRWQPRSFTGVARFRVRVTDGKGNFVGTDLFRYNNLGTLLNRTQSMTLLEDGPAVDLNPASPWWIVAPSFNTGFARYTAELRLSDPFAAIIRAKRTAGVDYGTATAEWFPAVVGALSSQVGTVAINNGTRGRRGGYRWSVGDTARIAGGTGTSAVIRIDEITGPFQVPFQTMTPFITAVGSGYAVGNFVRLNGGTNAGYGHRMRVTSINGSGGVTGLVEDGAGGGIYTVLPPTGTPLTVTNETGSGTGLTVTLPNGMPLAGAATAVSLTNLGSYTANPTPTTNNEVITLTGTGFWLQVDFTMGTGIVTGGFFRVEGLRDDVNNVLGDLNITLSPDYVAPFNIACNVTSNLGLNISGTMVCTITNTADQTILNNANITHNWREDEVYTFAPPIFVSDNDPDALTFTASLTAAAGALASPTGGSWNAATRVWRAATLQGPLNSILAGLQFTPVQNHDTNFSIVIRVGDAMGTLTMSAIPAPDPTVLTAPGTYVYNPQSKHFLAPPVITVTDPDTNDVITLTAAPSTAGAGLLNSDASGWTRLGTNGLRVVGSASTVNNVLSSLNWTANSTASLNLSGATSRTWTEDVRHAMPNFVSVAGAGFDTSTLNLTVAASSNTGDTSQRTIILRPDPIYAPGTVQLVITMPLLAGSLDLPAVSGTARTAESLGTTNRTYTVTGVDRDVNDIIAGATFVPALNYDRNFTITAALSGSTLNIGMTCTEVDDPTIVSIPPQWIGYSAGSMVSAMPAVSLSDADTGENIFARVSVVPVGSGQVTATVPGWASMPDGVLQVSGASLGAANSILASLRFAPASLAMPAVVTSNATYRIAPTSSFLAVSPVGLVEFGNRFFQRDATLTVEARRSGASLAPTVATRLMLATISDVVVTASMQITRPPLDPVSALRPYDVSYNSRPSPLAADGRTDFGFWPGNLWSYTLSPAGVIVLSATANSARLNASLQNVEWFFTLSQRQNFRATLIVNASSSLGSIQRTVLIDGLV